MRKPSPKWHLLIDPIRKRPGFAVLACALGFGRGLLDVIGYIGDIDTLAIWAARAWRWLESSSPGWMWWLLALVPLAVVYQDYWLPLLPKIRPGPRVELLPKIVFEPMGAMSRAVQVRLYIKNPRRWMVRGCTVRCASIFPGIDSGCPTDSVLLPWITPFSQGSKHSVDIPGRSGDRGVDVAFFDNRCGQLFMAGQRSETFCQTRKFIITFEAEKPSVRIERELVVVTGFKQKMHGDKRENTVPLGVGFAEEKPGPSVVLHWKQGDGDSTYLTTGWVAPPTPDTPDSPTEPASPARP